MNLASTIRIFGVGTSEGAIRGWDTRGRSAHPEGGSFKLAAGWEKNWYVGKDYHKRWLSTGEAQVIEVPTSKITHSPEQPGDYSASKVVASQAKEIREGGKLPIASGWYDEDDGLVHLSDGHHRFEAVKEVGQETMPVIIGAKALPPLDQTK